MTSCFSCKRIVVVGTTSSGKSTLASQLAQKISADFIELDALHWEPNWVEAPDKVFRERVIKATNSMSWVVAGNYSAVRDVVWLRAEVIIWLDYPFHIVFWRLLTRTIRRVATREILFAGNIENGWTHLKLWSEESLFHWLLKTYWRRKREYPMLFALPQNAHLKIIRFKHPKEAEHWLKNLSLEPTDQLPQPKQNNDHE
jgi:adenylate kinase family enzyme